MAYDYPGMVWFRAGFFYHPQIRTTEMKDLLGSLNLALLNIKHAIDSDPETAKHALDKLVSINTQSIENEIAFDNTVEAAQRGPANPLD